MVKDSVLHSLDFSSPVGTLRLSANKNAIVSIDFNEGPVFFTDSDSAFLNKCARQLQEYFAGTRTVFSIPIQLGGTSFQQRIWSMVAEIPLGKTKSYLDLALAAGDRNLIRAVGGANGANRLPILIPCHRVIGADGKLTGYAGGLWRKKWLLDFEGRQARPQLFSPIETTHEKI